VESALQTRESELQSMTRRARQRTLDEHTGKVRAGQLLKYLEEAFSAKNEYVQSEVAL